MQPHACRNFIKSMISGECTSALPYVCYSIVKLVLMKTSFPPSEAFSALLRYFNGKRTTSSDKTDSTAASMLISKPCGHFSFMSTFRLLSNSASFQEVFPSLEYFFLDPLVAIFIFHHTRCSLSGSGHQSFGEFRVT